MHYEEICRFLSKIDSIRSPNEWPSMSKLRMLLFFEGMKPLNIELIHEVLKMWKTNYVNI